jgi:pyrroline-5-carboxylate reductase
MMRLSTSTGHAAPPASPKADVSLRNVTVGFVGAGRMAEAMFAGMLGAADVLPSNIIACDRDKDRLSFLHETYGIDVCDSPQDVVRNSDVAMICVKPQGMGTLSKQLFGSVPEKTLLMSCVAGYTISQLQENFDTTSVVRIMPNTPALIQESTTAWTISAAVSPMQQLLARRIIQSFGSDIYMPEEEHLDMATALVGFGPAMCHLLLEALIDAGVHMGLSRDVAWKMVVNTVRGATNLTLAAEKHPSLLRHDITSPGGTTAAGLYQLEKGGMRTVLSDAAWAAFRRSRELGGLDTCIGPGRYQSTTNLELPEELLENLQHVSDSVKASQTA